MKGKTDNELRRTGSAGAALCLAVLIAIGWIALRWNTPPLRITRNGLTLKVDVSTLGEYPTTVSRIRLSEARNHDVVWELSANGIAQMHGFKLVVGQNPVRVDTDYGSFRVVTPSGSNSFDLKKGAEYRIDVWGGSGSFTRKSSSFHLGNTND